MKKIIMSLICSLLFLSATSTVNAQEMKNQNWQDEMIYSLMVDRFSDGDIDNDYDVDVRDSLSYQGGDFQGVIDQLDYIKDMNFTVVQLSSVFENEEGGFHGEWIKDYTQPDPHFGTKEEFGQLVNVVHKNKMKIVLEIPVMSPEEYPNVEEKLVPAIRDWINIGVDGIQMNHLSNLSPSYWEQFISELKRTKPDLFIAGFDGDFNESDLKTYEQLGFDSMVNVPINGILRTDLSRQDRSFQPILDHLLKKESEDSQRIAFFDNQYTPRFTDKMLDGDVYPINGWKRALTFLYTQPEIPQLYYATETAVVGKEIPENTPLLNLRADEELKDYITQLGKVRKEQPALTKGTVEVLYEKNGMVVFKRQYKEDTLVIAINNTTNDQSISLSADKLDDDKELRGLLNTDLVRSENGEYVLVIDRDQSEIYKLMEKSGYNIFFIFSIFIVFVLFVIFMYVAWRRGKNKTIS